MRNTLNSNIIKIIAIIAMTIDHIAWYVFPGCVVEPLPIMLHVIGRLTCPIMCYFIAEGYYHTKDIGKYTKRLFVFAIISHFAYIFMFSGLRNWRVFIPFYYGSILNQTSVMWSLAWGLVMLRVTHSEKIKESIKPIFIMLICLISFPSDWSCVASLCILAFGTNRGNFKAQMLWMVFYVGIYSVVYFFALDRVYGIMQMAVILAIPILMMYNGQRGQNQIINKILKWTFYIYYPLHLFVLGCIQFIQHM